MQSSDKATEPRKRRLPRWLSIILGLLFIAVGILGIFLPFLQGLLFIAAGLLLLSEAIPAVRRRMEQLEAQSSLFGRFSRLVRDKEGMVNIGALLIWVIALTIAAAALGYGFYYLFRK